jgi:large subunit ribosomal protein L25
MDTLKLKADIRPKGKDQVKTLRRTGFVPAVVYGKGRETELLQIEAKTLDKVLSEAGTHQIISLEIAKKGPVMTLAREIQRDVIKRDYLHVDFLAVKMDEKIQAEVPITLVGESPAVKEQGGILTQSLDMLLIECLPGNLPSAIEVDVSGLMEFNDSLLVSDVVALADVDVITDSEYMVAKIEAPRKAEELEALDGEVESSSAEPEVITEARDEE